jgi:hypothetical protein
MTLASQFHALRDVIVATPGVTFLSAGDTADSGWWVKLAIDLDHRIAWNVVQEYAHILNYLSLSERLPTVFMPVSPPPYLNGGPREFLSWAIECRELSTSPDAVASWLKERLPKPIDDLDQWET